MVADPVQFVESMNVELRTWIPTRSNYSKSESF